MSKSEARVLSGTYDAVFRGVCDAVQAEGMTVQSADPAAGHIRLSSRVSFATWGENLDVNLRPVGPDSVEVTVRSALKIGLVDWGKNRANIERLFRRIAESPRHPGGAWLPDPSARHSFGGGTAADGPRTSATAAGPASTHSTRVRLRPTPMPAPSGAPSRFAPATSANHMPCGM